MECGNSLESAQPQTKTQVADTTASVALSLSTHHSAGEHQTRLPSGIRPNDLLFYRVGVSPPTGCQPVSHFDDNPTNSTGHHHRPHPTQSQCPHAELLQRHPSHDRRRTVTGPGAPRAVPKRSGGSFLRHLRAAREVPQAQAMASRSDQVELETPHMELETPRMALPNRHMVGQRIPSQVRSKDIAFDAPPSRPHF